MDNHSDRWTALSVLSDSEICFRTSGRRDFVNSPPCTSCQRWPPDQIAILFVNFEPSSRQLPPLTERKKCLHYVGTLSPAAGVRTPPSHICYRASRSSLVP